MGAVVNLHTQLIDLQLEAREIKLKKRDWDSEHEDPISATKDPSFPVLGLVRDIDLEKITRHTEAGKVPKRERLPYRWQRRSLLYLRTTLPTWVELNKKDRKTIRRLTRRMGEVKDDDSFTASDKQKKHISAGIRWLHKLADEVDSRTSACFKRRKAVFDRVRLKIMAGLDSHDKDSEKHHKFRRSVRKLAHLYALPVLEGTGNGYEDLAITLYALSQFIGDRHENEDYRRLPEYCLNLIRATVE